MKAAQIIKHREPLVVGEVADPTPGPKDAVVKVEASGICRSDWHAWMGDWEWLGLSPELPIIPGHEFGGEVVAIGNEVKNIQVGDRVTSPFHHGCSHCANCMNGNSNRCDNLNIYGFNFNGSYAEYILVTEADFNLIQLPDEVDAQTAAAIGCRYMTGFHAVNRARVRPGEWLVVHGTGGVGLSATQVAAASGALVIAVDIDDDKLTKAKEEGAAYTINAKDENTTEAIREITKGGAHVSIEALGIEETILNSVFSLRKGGRHIQVGLTTSEEGGFVGLPVDMITSMELEILGSIGNPHTDYDGLLQLISSGRLNPKTLVSKEVSLNEASKVLDEMTSYNTLGFNIITNFS